MPLDRADVEKIAQLARLAIDEAADTAGVTPMAHPLHMRQRLRPDQVTEPDRRDRYQAIAPAIEDGLYLVPKVIE
jgi:aspartyl-tRNA(Asn)/glutamyl-tRNA(Gln) amidotransferase subunit C